MTTEIKFQLKTKCLLLENIKNSTISITKINYND